MRGLIVFNESSGVSFYSVDDEFQLFLQHRLKETGAGQPEDENDEFSFGDDLREALASFFLPLLASYDILSSLKKPLLSITADDDIMIVFKKHMNLVMVVVNGDGSETEEDLMRKLHVFGRILCFQYGPALNRMSPPNLQMKAVEWKRLNSLLKSYEILFNSEQSFLLEAVEHVRFGQLNLAQDACISLADDCLNSNLNGGIPNMKHSLLIVGNRVLASCGRSPQLPTADTLLLILLTANIYCHDNTNEDSTNESTDDKCTTSTPDGEEEDNDLQFRTPYQTPTGPLQQDEDSNSQVEDFANQTEVDDRQTFKTPHQDHDDEEGDEMSTKSSFKGRIRNMLGGLSKSKGGKYSGNYSFSNDLNKNPKFYEQKIFLQLNPNQYIPHMIHCLEVYPQIVLVLISEPTSVNLAGVIGQTLANLRQGFQFTSGKGSSLSGRALYDIIEDSIKRIIDGSRSEAASLNSESLKKHVLKVYNSWKRLKEANFLKFLEKNISEQVEITRCINNGETTIDALIGLFEELYLSPKVSEYDKQFVISKLQRLSLKLARDYGDYLYTKATINLPFSGFDTTYPGMVHFSFVDRSFDELATPSVVDETVNPRNLESLKRGLKMESSPSVLLKEKIWEMVKRCQRYLSLGYTSQTWMDDHFVYVYFLWICVPNNSRENIFRHAAPSNVRSHEDEPPGVFCGTFYKDMMSGLEGNTPGYVNELYCIFEPNVPIDMATVHCKNLAAQLLSNTKQSIVPFPLIN